MKRLTVLFLSVVGFCLMLGTAMADDKVYNLKLQSMHPPSLLTYMETFAKDVELASQGRIKIQVFAAGELVNTVNTLKAVGTGTVDIGHACGNYYSEFTMGNIEGGLPMSWASPQEAQMIFDNLGLQKLLEAEYEKHGAVYLNSMWAVPYQILSKEPINSLDDLRQMKLRSVPPTSRIFDSLDVKTVSIPAEDQYLALSTGQVDAVIYGAGYEYYINKFYEVAPYLVETPITNPFVDHMIINKQLWDSMPADLQAIMKLATDKMRWFYYLMCVANFDEIKDKAFKGVTTLPDADVKALTAASQAIWEEEAARSPENAKAMEIIKGVARAGGRL